MDDVVESVRKALADKPPAGKLVGEALTSLRTVDVRSARTILAQLREVKSPSEIAAISAAWSRKRDRIKRVPW